ncbi:hypothetical protein KI387_038957 [Taxus chinensis]|uniref:Uncharacterized protein n=1 Tax=Taxus chinensis TaxID=29808 RepID=A0AA38CCY0_TAXCH|nr:hypothetical protein KI387_038957 [Taxus chinensis]
MLSSFSVIPRNEIKSPTYTSTITILNYRCNDVCDDEISLEMGMRHCIISSLLPMLPYAISLCKLLHFINRTFLRSPIHVQGDVVLITGASSGIGQVAKQTAGSGKGLQAAQNGNRQVVGLRSGMRQVIGMASVQGRRTQRKSISETPTVDFIFISRQQGSVAAQKMESNRFSTSMYKLI